MILTGGEGAFTAAGVALVGNAGAWIFSTREGKRSRAHADRIARASRMSERRIEAFIQVVTYVRWCQEMAEWYRQEATGWIEALRRSQPERPAILDEQAEALATLFMPESLHEKVLAYTQTVAALKFADFDFRNGPRGQPSVDAHRVLIDLCDKVRGDGDLLCNAMRHELND